MRLSLAISPCPNDTFAFEALLAGRVDTEGLEFDVRFDDIENLNASLLDADASTDVSKMSYAVLPALLTRYRLCDAGSALGYGTGPVVVAREASVDVLRPGAILAVPGLNTTANRLAAKYFPFIDDKIERRFDLVAGAVLDGQADAGVMIHEGRFTYRDHGLTMLADLGELWEAEMNVPLPLGGIVVSRALPVEIQQAVGRVIRRSVEYAMANPSASEAFVKAHAQEMDPGVIRRHIATFVNDNTITLNDKAREGICALLGLNKDLLL